PQRHRKRPASVRRSGGRGWPGQPSSPSPPNGRCSTVVSSLPHAFSLTHPGLLAAGLLAPALAIAVWALLPPPLTSLRSRLSLALRVGMLLLIVAALAGLSFNRVPGS